MERHDQHRQSKSFAIIHGINSEGRGAGRGEMKKGNL